jgi:hypothetical protein
MRARLVFFLALAVALATVASAQAAPRTQTCPTRSVGPGKLLRGGTAGAECMLRAFQRRCASAAYELSTFGVDAVTIVRFNLARHKTGCVIEVTRSFRVVPHKPHVLSTFRCKTISRAERDIVATQCKSRARGLSTTTSLLHY